MGIFHREEHEKEVSFNNHSTIWGLRREEGCKGAIEVVWALGRMFWKSAENLHGVCTQHDKGCYWYQDKPAIDEFSGG